MGKVLDKPKKESGIKRLPESSRKIILFVSLIISISIISVIWFISLKINLGSITPRPKDPQWEKIKNDLNNIFNQNENQVDNSVPVLPKNQVATTTEAAATTTLEINQNDLNLIKEKLKEIQIQKE